LELPELIDKNPNWEFAIEELRRMDNYKPPRDKLICITNCIKIIMSILKKVTEGPSGADIVLPTLVYLVAKANVPNLNSNIEYIINYRDKKVLLTESGKVFL
jgi:Rab5 GDP/GTP exchange factor